MKNLYSHNAIAQIALAFLLTTSSGCATLCGVSHECACCNDCCCGNGIGESSDVYRIADDCPRCRYCFGCLGSGCGPLARRRDQMRIEVGPPAVRYRPEMPPEFLPVPVTPIIANVNPNAPADIRGAVELGWPPPCQLTITGRD